MNSHEYQNERHAALWAAGSQQVGRWVFGTVVFGILAMMKVIIPYGEHAGEFHRTKAGLDEVREKLAETLAESTNNTMALAAVSQALKASEAAPWEAEMESLKKDFRELGNDYRLLRETAPAEIRKVLGSEPGAPKPPPALRSRPGLSRADARQLPPELTSTTDGPVRGPATRADPLGIRTIGPLTYTKEERLARAVNRFGLNATTDLISGASDAHFQETLRDQAVLVFRKRANTTRTNLAEIARRELVIPMETTLAKLPTNSTSRAAVAATLTKLRQAATPGTGNAPTTDDWWTTIEGKEAVTAQMQSRLSAAQQELRDVLQEGENDLQATRDSLREQEAALAESEAGEKAALEEAAQAMEALLPDWLKGLFGVPTLLQLYPAALLILGAEVLRRLFKVRRHFRRVREARNLDARTLEDPATSTLWTLTWRGRWGTCCTGLAVTAFLAVIVILEILARTHLAAGLALLQEDSQLLIRPPLALATCQWGALLAALAAVVVLESLRREVTRVRRSSPS